MRKAVVIFIFISFVFMVGFAVDAAFTKDAQWHSSDAVIIEVGGFNVTLDDAINNGYYFGVAIPKTSSPIPDCGHLASEILITTKDGYKMTLQEAFDNKALEGYSHNITTELLSGHLASEIEVSEGVSLQDFINNNGFAKSCDSNVGEICGGGECIIGNGIIDCNGNCIIENKPDGTDCSGGTCSSGICCSSLVGQDCSPANCTRPLTTTRGNVFNSVTTITCDCSVKSEYNCEGICVSVENKPDGTSCKYDKSSGKCSDGECCHNYDMLGEACEYGSCMKGVMGCDTCEVNYQSPAGTPCHDPALVSDVHAVCHYFPGYYTPAVANYPGYGVTFCCVPNVGEYCHPLDDKDRPIPCRYGELDCSGVYCWSDGKNPAGTVCTTRGGKNGVCNENGDCID